MDDLFPALSAKKNNNNPIVCLTLPITCQICLGKVKEPSVCPNQHVFCTQCIDMWLEKTKQCPTCRVAITKENPCKKILGGADSVDDVDALKPTEFSHPASRKARFMSLAQQYEDEIDRLHKYIDSLNKEISTLKENNFNPDVASLDKSSDERIQTLNADYQAARSDLEKISKENELLKETNKRLESENSILIQEVSHLKASLNEKNAQISSRYTMVVLESKLESYEKEIKQLQKALDKSDRYIAELENRPKDKSSLVLSDISTISGPISSNEVSPDVVKSQADNEVKRPQSSVSKSTDSCIPSSKANNIVFVSPMKFKRSDDVVKYRCSPKVVKSSDSKLTPDLISPPKPVIGNARFYGSPSKHPQIEVAQSPKKSTIPSFSDRIKKNLFTPQSTNVKSEHQSTSWAENQSCEAVTDLTCSPRKQPQQQTLFSPMKRLRLDENTCHFDSSTTTMNKNLNTNINPSHVENSSNELNQVSTSANNTSTVDVFTINESSFRFMPVSNVQAHN